MATEVEMVRDISSNVEFALSGFSQQRQQQERKNPTMDENESRRGLSIAQPAFRIWLCGTFSVERYVDSQYKPIRIVDWGGSSYPRLLLKALLRCPGRQARRETLLEMLWPEVGFEQAAQSLNTATTKLRHVLRPAKGHESLLVTNDDSSSYCLMDQSFLWSDSDAALALLKDVEHLGRSTPEAVPLLEEAASYFNRGTFLEGEEGLWASGKRATVDRACYRCRLWLAEAYEQQEMFGQAESVLSLLLEDDPTDEDVLCRLMELLHRQGMTHQALRLYEHSCEVFAKEDMDLTEATKDLAAQLSLRDKRIQGVYAIPSQTSSQSNDFSLLSQSLLQSIMESVRERREASIDLKPALTKKDDMDKRRRDLLHLLSQAGMTLALPFPNLDWDRIEGALAKPSRLDETVLHSLETINGSLWSMYLTTPIKSSVFESALGHFKTLIQFLKDPHPTANHQRLCVLTSEIGQLVGEIFFDLNDHEAAESCYTVAALSAKEGQSYDLWSCSLVRSAFLPMYRGHYEDALTLLQCAFKLSQRGDSLLPTRYWVAAVEAEAYSGVLDLAACQNALDRAQGVQNRKETSLPWVRFSHTRLPALHGACYIRLRQPALAMPVLQEALRTFVKPDRKRGMALTDLAAAAVQLGDVEQARLYVDEIMTILTLGSSGFLREGLRTLPQRLKPVAQTACVKALDQYIGQQLRLPLS